MKCDHSLKQNLNFHSGAVDNFTGGNTGHFKLHQCLTPVKSVSNSIKEKYKLWTIVNFVCKSNSFIELSGWDTFRILLDQEQFPPAGLEHLKIQSENLLDLKPNFKLILILK